MTDLAGALLRAALGFVEQRLRQVEQQALASAADLAAQVGGAGGNLPAAEPELAQARTELANFAAGLAQPVSLANEKAAVAHLATALRHVDTALDLVSPGSHLPALLKTPFEGPIAPKGLAQQLDLRAPGGVALDGVTLRYDITSGGPITIPGPPPLRAQAARLRALLVLDGSAPALALVLALDGVEIAVSGAGFDGFVTTLFGNAAHASADVSLGVDSERGVTVAGATHGPVMLPARGTTPLLDVHGLTLDAPADAAGAIDLGAQITGALGSAVRFNVDGIGLRAAIDADAVGVGTPIRLSPKAPRGVGATLDGGLVRGGGYLDVHDGTYSGALDVKLAAVEAKAFGILDTRVSGGYALVVAISAEFSPPIEIALGFTLNGVGGIVGIQRTLDTDALRARLHDHAIDHLLFPADPVSAAPQILQTLGAVFPPLRGGVVVGPMVKLGWGRPVSFVTAALGVVVVLPDPKIVILGNFRLAVPAPDLPIVDLKGSVFSEITAEHVVVLCVLEDSRIAGYPASGDLGFFLGYGSSPDFAISAGGFHPRYTPPRELADMRRLTIDLSPPVALTIRASAYVAFTSNSFQLGGRLEAEGDAGPVGIHGFVQLDAIVRWAPAFAFEADLGAGFEMRFAGETFAGVELQLHLAGPAPWVAHGTATLELPILPDIDVEVGPLQWGDTHNPPPPLAHPLDLVHDALSRADAWRPELPQGADALVTVRSDPSDPPLLVHPLGLFEGRQRAVPLETMLARVGPSPIAEREARVHLGQPTMTDGAGAPVDFGAVSPVSDHFAPGQFLELSDEDKLRRPGFEDMLAGIRLGPADGVRIPAQATQSDLQYDTVYPHQNLERQREPFFSLIGTAFEVLAAGAAGRSALRADVRYVSKPDPIVFAPAADVKIRAIADLAAPAGLPDEPLTYTHAAQLLSSLPNVGSLQLVALGTAP